VHEHEEQRVSQQPLTSEAAPQTNDLYGVVRAHWAWVAAGFSGLANGGTEFLLTGNKFCFSRILADRAKSSIYAGFTRILTDAR
jgi:hypothetical protein